MSYIQIKKEQWNKIAEFLQQHPKVYVGNKKECRRFLTGVLWMMRSGSQWRLLPKQYGKLNIQSHSVVDVMRGYILDGFEAIGFAPANEKGKF